MPIKVLWRDCQDLPRDSSQLIPGDRPVSSLGRQDAGGLGVGQYGVFVSAGIGASRFRLFN